MKNIDGTKLNEMAVIMGAEVVSVGLECLKNYTDPQSRVEREKNRQNFELEQGKHSVQVSRERADFTFKLMDRGESLESALTAGGDIYGPALHKKSLLARAKEAPLGRGALLVGLGVGLGVGVGVGVGVGYWAGTRRSSGVDSKAFEYQLGAPEDNNLLEVQEHNSFEAPETSYSS